MRMNEGGGRRRWRSLSDVGWDERGRKDSGEEDSEPHHHVITLHHHRVFELGVSDFVQK